MQPVRTYEAVLHGERVLVKVYPSNKASHVQWVLRTADRERAMWTIDQTATEEAAVPEPRPRKPVDPLDWEE
jgi:hypothetical protein